MNFGFMRDYVHHISSEAGGKVLVATGGGGSLIQAYTDWANLFVAGGNALLIIAGLYMAYHKIFNNKKD